MVKVIVAGSRGFRDYRLLQEKLDFYLQNYSDVEIVSGGARGADRLGEQYARTKGFKLRLFPANWDLYGKKAGYLRNQQMAQYADYCVVFWDGKSRGTQHMIRLARQYKLNLRIVNFS